jgi:hypothetical protein
MAMAIVAAEEVAREVARGVKVEVSVEPQRPSKTKVIRLVDVGPGIIVSEVGSGRLVELVVISGVKNYELTVEADGKVLSNGPFDWYQTISQYSEWVDAFENNGTFILRISDISFSTSLGVRFRPVVSTLTTPVKLKEVVVKIDKW